MALPTNYPRTDLPKTALKRAQNEQFPLANRDFTKARLYKEGVGVPA